MNDLQLALLTVGGGVIVIMVAWNWWQDLRVRKQNNQRFEHPTDDPLLYGQGRAEPTIHVPSGDVPQGQSLPAQFDQQMMAGVNAAVTQPSPTAGAAAPLDEKLHAVLYISLDKPLAVDMVNDRLQLLRRAGNKPVRIACTRADEQDDTWYLPAAGLQIANIRLAIQLANRKGPLTAIEYSEFIARLEQFVELYAGQIESPDMAEVITRADKLDQQAASLDTLMGLHCVLPDTVSPQVLQDQLVNGGWVNVGRHWWLAEGDQPLASVVIHDTPGKRVMSFTLDVPNASDPIRAIDAIASLGTRIADSYTGALMDDAGRQLNSHAVQAIREQLTQRAQSLTQAGFAPGSLSARLLFA